MHHHTDLFVETKESISLKAKAFGFRQILILTSPLDITTLFTPSATNVANNT